MAHRFSLALLLSALPVLVAVAGENSKAVTTASVPIRLNGTEAPVLVVRVQGKDLPLQLDLGDASSLVLHPEVLAALSSEPTAETFKGFSMDGQIETPVVRLDMVEVGALKIYGVSARQDVHDDAFRNYKKTELGAVGFIGTGMFESGQILIDYPRLKVSFSLSGKSGQTPSLCRGRSVPIVRNRYGLTTAVDTDIGILQLGWDTGAPAILISKSAAISGHLAADLESIEFKKLVVAGKNFGPQHVQIWNIPLPTEIAGLIGHPFFQKHSVCFDYSRLTLHIR